MDRLTTQDLKHHPLLSAEEEHVLIRRAQAGDNDARDELVRCNARLILKVTSRFRAVSDLDGDDLFQEGVLGLILAIEKFNLELPHRLSTYAYTKIRQKVSRACDDTGHAVRSPIHARNALRKQRREVPLTSPGERKQAELARAASGVTSLDRPITTSDGDEVTLGDYRADEGVGPEEAVLDTDRREQLLNGLTILTPREQKVLTLRFGLADDVSRTRQVIGRILRVTRERIRQCEEKALRKLRARHPELSSLLTS